MGSNRAARDKTAIHASTELSAALHTTGQTCKQSQKGALCTMPKTRGADTPVQLGSWGQTRLFRLTVQQLVAFNTQVVYNLERLVRCDVCRAYITLLPFPHTVLLQQGCPWVDKARLIHPIIQVTLHTAVQVVTARHAICRHSNCLNVCRS